MQCHLVSRCVDLQPSLLHTGKDNCCSMLLSYRIPPFRRAWSPKLYHSRQWSNLPRLSSMTCSWERPCSVNLSIPRKMSCEQIPLKMNPLKYHCMPNTGLETGQALKSVSENIIRKKNFYHLVFCLAIESMSR
jgi:hypothetical protein